MLHYLFDDIRAAVRQDPAARGLLAPLLIMITYSGFHSILFHRITQLYNWIPPLARCLSQCARFITGVEIHPGAVIGKGFFIDHGNGVVIGETTIIGECVTLFQGVTLGGTGKESGKRHPTLGSHIVVGAGAKILGNITIGDHVKIGANSVVLKPVPDHSTVVGIPATIVRIQGERIGDDLDHDNLPDPLITQLRKLQKQIDILMNTKQHLDT